jgi:hypothetical protein
MEEQSTQTASIEEIQQRFKGWRAQGKIGVQNWGQRDIIFPGTTNYAKPVSREHSEQPTENHREPYFCRNSSEV